ncbi:MAG: urea ABC transporter substrate-binding protein [Chromatiales bacterium]|nr:urea ABC transporter substrate-binding protein [Chromatiales bacterium]
MRLIGFLVLMIPAVTYAQNGAEPIKIGVLHSLSGPMGENGRPLVDAAELAVDELNKSGGLLGHEIEMVVVDGKSDWELFAHEAKRLIEKEHVSAIFGCWTSSCRKAVKPVVEKLNGLLFYPVQYEGLEESKNIIYMGAPPNQQIIPGVSWALNHLGKRLYLVGSDYIFPRAANLIIRDVAQANKGEVIGEHYVPLHSHAMTAVINDVQKLQPDVILNTINGEGNRYLFESLKQAGLDDIPIVSFSVSESEIENIEKAHRNNHYAVWSYFQSIDSEVNRSFVRKFKRRFGSERVIGEPMESTYVGIKLWAKAVREIQSKDPVSVTKNLSNQSIEAPEGIVSVDAKTHHLWKMIRIGKAQKNGQFNIVWKSKYPIRPVPFPSYRLRPLWDKVFDELLSSGIQK